jgi:hypothetical protein
VARFQFNRRSWFVVGLLVLSPLTAEFLLGNQPITQVGGLVLLAPVYGGAATLIREITRRTGRGWPTMILLSAAYGLILEGLIDQMLFNPGYVGLGSFEGLSQIPGLGISASMLQATLTMHTIWSMCVPIALVEAFDREPNQPWLGRFGLTLVALIFIVSSIVLRLYQAQETHFMASAGQLIGTTIAIVALCMAAFVIKPRPKSQARKPAPKPWMVAAASFGLTSIYWLESTFVSDNSDLTQWLGVAWWFVLAVAAASLFLRWSRRRGWTDLHRLAVAGGALLTYVWVGFVHGRYLTASPPIVITGNVIFGVSAILLLLTALRTKRTTLR